MDDGVPPTGAVLVFARDGGMDGGALPLVVALHDRGGDAAAALAAARRRFGERPDLLAPQAARPCNPFQSNLRSAPAYAGFSWYLGGDAEHPEAASFGDALAALEAFVVEVDREYVLSGDGQGGVLAATLALYAPDGLAGVHAAGSATAILDGWQPPAVRLDGLPVLATDARGRTALTDTLGERGAEVHRGEAATWLERIGARRCGDPR